MSRLKLCLHFSSDNRERLRDIAALTWPQLLMLLCQFVIGIADVWAAGRLGPEIQASFGLIAQCQMVLMILCTAAVSSAVAAVSQSLGAGRKDRARRYTGLVCTAGIASGMGLALGGHALRDIFLSMLQTPEFILPSATTFFNATMWAMPGHYGMTIGTALFRSAKSVFLPLYTVCSIALLNVVGDLGFGLGWWGFPSLGAAGIAWSSCITVNFGALILHILLYREGLLTAISRPRRKWVRCAAPYLLKVAGPALGTSALWQSGYLVLYVITASLPVNSVNALAGLTTGLRIEALLFLPAIAFNMTASVLIGHALGKGDKSEARRLVTIILAAGCISMSLAGMLLWPARAELAAFMAPDPAVQAEIFSYLTCNILAVPFTVASIILTGSFNGAGAAALPMTAFSLSIWLVRLPLAWLLGHCIFMAASGIFMAMLISQAVQAFLLLWFFLHLDWTRFAMHHTTSSRS